MKKMTILALTAAGAAMAIGTPAAAQYRPAPQGYGYNNYGQLRAYQARVDGIQRQIGALYSSRMINRNEYNALRKESYGVEQRLRRSSRYGLNPSEARDVENRIYRLERHVAHEVRDGNYWNDRNRRRF